MKLKLYWGNKRKIEVPQIVLTLGEPAGQECSLKHNTALCHRPASIPAPRAGAVPI